MLRIRGARGACEAVYAPMGRADHWGSRCADIRGRSALRDDASGRHRLGQRHRTCPQLQRRRSGRRHSDSRHRASGEAGGQFVAATILDAGTEEHRVEGIRLGGDAVPARGSRDAPWASTLGVGPGILLQRGFGQYPHGKALPHSDADRRRNAASVQQQRPRDHAGRTGKSGLLRRRGRDGDGGDGIRRSGDSRGYFSGVRPPSGVVRPLADGPIPSGRASGGLRVRHRFLGSAGVPDGIRPPLLVRGCGAELRRTAGSHGADDGRAETASLRRNRCAPAPRLRAVRGIFWCLEPEIGPFALPS